MELLLMLPYMTLSAILDLIEWSHHRLLSHPPPSLYANDSIFFQ